MNKQQDILDFEVQKINLTSSNKSSLIMTTFDADVNPNKFREKKSHEEKMFGIFSVRKIGLTRMNVAIMYISYFITELSWKWVVYYQTYFFINQLDAPNDSY
jgi:hypothetical protein